MTEKQSNPRTLNGTVVSNKMDKTIVVLVERRVANDVGDRG
ncbi:MAG: 30S ribosomal protein S17 [Gammaproteobacteria bacterium]|nr:30S ribosomal protein S17 [Gammaproteobacteria bacterium]